MNDLGKIGVNLRRGLAGVIIGLGAMTAPATAADAPPGGPGSLHGIWSNVNFTDVRTGPPPDEAPAFNDSNGQPLPVQPWAAEILKERVLGWEEGKIYVNHSDNCVHDGMPAGIGTNAQSPIQIIEAPDQKQVVILYETYQAFRTIKMDQQHPPNPTPSFMGDAIGRWEGDTLVVETIAISKETAVRGALPHSDKLRIVERIRRTGPETMENIATIEDPEVFTRPWTQRFRGKKVPGMRMAEFICTNNRSFAEE